MKPTFLRCAAALAAGAALLAALPATAAPAAPAADKQPAPAPSPAMAAIQSLLRELQKVDERKLPATVLMERMAARQPSAETADKLRAAFGTTRLYTLARQPPRPGRVDWRLGIPALHYAPTGGTAFDWSEGGIDFRYNPAGTVANVRGTWRSFDADDGEVRFETRGMTLDSRQAQGADKLWYGRARMAAAAIRMQPRDGADGLALEMTAPAITVAVADKGRTADLDYDLRIGRLEAAGERIDDLRLALRLVKLDKTALVALGDASARADVGAETPAQQAAFFKPLLRDLGAALVARGAALEIDEISARYHGARAVLKGRIGLQGATAADLDDPQAFLGKIVARFDVRIPVALVREISGTIAARQAAAQDKASDPQSVAQLGQSMSDVVVGKLLGGGFARLENDVLVSTVEWRGGALFANGKPVPLPAPDAPSAPSAPEHPAPAPARPPVAAAARGADVLQARRIDGSCTLPDYPDNVVRQDLALEARFAFVVTADGKVLAPAVASASDFPDYDRAVAAALATCTYAPALRGGKPFDLATSWRLVRAPGSTRP